MDSRLYSFFCQLFRIKSNTIIFQKRRLHKKKIHLAERLLLALSYSSWALIYSAFNIEIINLQTHTTCWKPDLLERLTYYELNVKLPSALLLSLLLAQYSVHLRTNYISAISTVFIKINRILTVYFRAAVSTRSYMALTDLHDMSPLPPRGTILTQYTPWNFLKISQGTDENYLHPY